MVRNPLVQTLDMIGTFGSYSIEARSITCLQSHLAVLLFADTLNWIHQILNHYTSTR